MKRQGTFLSVGRLGGSLLAMAGLILLAGCSSSMSRVQTWEGTVENADRVAVLSASGPIRVQAVNGRPMTNFLMDDLDLEYELLPGENQIVFTYKTIWAKSGVVENGESKVHVVETPPQVVTVDAEPGAVYRFDTEQPETRQQAEAMAEDFSAALVNASGQTVATSAPWPASGSGMVAERTPVPDSRLSAAPIDETSATTLERLKALWGKASEEEKREFLSWAFD